MGTRGFGKTEGLLLLPVITNTVLVVSRTHLLIRKITVSSVLFFLVLPLTMWTTLGPQRSPHTCMSCTNALTVTV